MPDPQIAVSADERRAEYESAQRLARRYRLEFVDMDHFPIDQDLFRSIPADLMLRYSFVPFKREGKALVIVVPDPTDLPMIDELSQLLGTPITVTVGARSAIESILKKSESSQRVLEEATESFQIQLLKDDDNLDENLTVERLTSDISPVIKLVDSTIFTAIQRRASDIHIETGDDAVHVKYRIDGVLQPAMRPIAKQFHSPIISRIKVMAELDIAEKRVPQDGRFKLKVPGKTIDFRVSIMPSVHGEDAVIRILDKESISEQFRELRLDILGFPEAELKRFRKYIAEPYGMVLVTGPTGSGKTDHALRGAVGDQIGRRQDHHDRRSRRIPAARHHADSDQREEGADVRARPAVDSAPRPGQDHGGRNPRPGNRADRHPVGADRAPGVHHGARQQRHRRARSVPEHGRRAVSVRVGAELRAGAAAGPHHLRRTANGRRSRAARCSKSRRMDPALADDAHLLRRRGLHRMRRHRVQGPHGHLRAARPDRLHPRDDPRAPRPSRRSRKWRTTKACGSCANRPWKKCWRASPRFARSTR